MSQDSTSAVGQVSADGQFRWDGAEWVPIPRGTREPTSWTRPLQLSTAAVLLAQAVYTVASTLLTVNRDSVLQSLHEAGSTVPEGMTDDQFATVALAFIYVFVAAIAVGELCGAAAAFFGWRWAFWVLLVVLGLFSLGALFGLVGFTRSVDAAVGELLALLNVAVFVWMIVAVSRFGPWALKRPGSSRA